MATNLSLLHSLITYYGNPFQARRMRRLYAGFLPPGALYFDVGAHVGNRVRIALQLGARVVAVEPNPRLFAWLDRLYANRKSVTLVQNAVGAKSGIARLQISRRTPTVSTLSTSWIERVQRDPSFERVSWDSSVAVEVVTLDLLIAAHGKPDFCKIDVEGYELQALQGLSAALPALCFEYLPATVDLAQACVAHLASMAEYEFNWAIGEESRLQAADWIGAQAMIDRLGNELRQGKSGDIYVRRAAAGRSRP